MTLVEWSQSPQISEASSSGNAETIVTRKPTVSEIISEINSIELYIVLMGKRSFFATVYVFYATFE